MKSLIWLYLSIISFCEGLTFSDLGLGSEIISAVKAQPGWVSPTPVQELAIPRLIELASKEKEDVVDAVWCEAPTGSGKTGAFGLSLLQNLKRNKVKGRISALILCPTRELAVQIGNVMENLSNNVSSKRRKNVMVLYGGIPLEPQICALSDYARYGETLDVLVATPGRLVDVLSHYKKFGDTSAQDAALERRLLNALDDKERISTSLSLKRINELKLDELVESFDGRESLINLLKDLQYLVIDEADRLLGRAFESEINEVLELLPPKIPTWLFSATLPKAIEPRLDQILKRIGAQDTIRIDCTLEDRISSMEEESSSSLLKKLNRTSTVALASKLTRVGPASTIDLRVIRLEKNGRTQALLKLLIDHPEWDRVIVFVATRYASEHVSRKLRRANIPSSELHGKLDQDVRSRRLSDLRLRKIRVLLATDVASRGIDIVGLPCVVNYDLPRSPVDFVHRIGRTGRAGKHGTAISFITPTTEKHMQLIEARHLKTPLVREVLKGFEPDEEKWKLDAQITQISLPGTLHSARGLAHDRMFGGIKGRRKNKKDKLREAAASKNN